ncbi:hypothetical protein ACUUL3_04780 [Thiovibrio sp. JS02]
MKKLIHKLNNSIPALMAAFAVLAVATAPAHAAFDLTTFTLDAGPVESLIMIILAALGTIWAGKYLLSFMKRG